MMKLMKMKETCLECMKTMKIDIGNDRKLMKWKVMKMMTHNENDRDNDKQHDEQ